jgi:hypothetical protein
VSVLPLSTWAWAAAVLAMADLLLLGLTVCALAWRHHRRNRPLAQLAEALLQGDLDKARFLLEAIRGHEGREMVAICRPTLESGPPAVARERFLRGYLAAYPSTPLGLKLWTAVVCGAGALLPFIVAGAGRADAISGALALGAAEPEAALTLYQLGIAETAAAGAVAWALILVAHRMDPGSPSSRRRMVARMLSADARR